VEEVFAGGDPSSWWFRRWEIVGRRGVLDGLEDERLLVEEEFLMV
jgi:hypothetical protein